MVATVIGKELGLVHKVTDILEIWLRGPVVDILKKKKKSLVLGDVLDLEIIFRFLSGEIVHGKTIHPTRENRRKSHINRERKCPTMSVLSLRCLQIF